MDTDLTGPIILTDFSHPSPSEGIVTKLVKYIFIILLILILPAISFVAGMKFQEKNPKFTLTLFGYPINDSLITGAGSSEVVVSQTTSNPLTPSQVTPVISNCKKYGYSDPEDFLKKYTTKSGDTLLSIAKNQLGDQLRVNEIVELNISRYLNLSVDSPLKENEMTLYLPPDYVKSSNGKLKEMNGELKEKSVKWWNVMGPTFSGFLLPDEKTVYLDNKPFEINDCIKMVFEKGVDKNRVLSVAHQ